MLTGGVSLGHGYRVGACEFGYSNLQISDSRGPDGFDHCPRDKSNLDSDLRAELENAGSNPAEKLELTH
jgi:hypothetical protein